MVDDTRAALKSHRAVLIQSECGSGKGTVCAYMIQRAVERGHFVLFLVRGRDRCADMHDRVTALGIPHGVLVGGNRRERWHQVQIASIDTVFRMQNKPKAQLLILDECHYALSPTFREVLDYYANCKIIGMSATPALGSGKALGVKSGGVFDAMVKGPSVTRLIAEGHLIGSRVFAPPPPADLNGLKKKSTGEFDSEQGAAICDNSKVIGDVVNHWERYGSDRKAAIFGFNQKHAFDIAENFRAAGHNWAYVDAETPDGSIHEPGTRKFFWHQMEHGDLVGVAAVNTISLGWDMPVCKYVGLASKTASFPLFRQRLGRGSRPYGNFKEFIAADHCSGLFEFIDQGPFFESEVDWQLDGDAVKTKDVDKASRVATCKTPVLMSESGPALSFRGPIDGNYMLPCLTTFPPGPQLCPYCGIPIISKERAIEVEDGELGEIAKEAYAAAAKQKSAAQQAHEEKMRQRYMELVRTGAKKKYKPGWPSLTFSNEYHRWPTKAWKEEAAEMLAIAEEAEATSVNPAAVRAAEVFSA